MKIERDRIKFSGIVGRGGSYEFICPSCRGRFINEVSRDARIINCSCGYRWHVDDKGKLIV